MSTIIARILNSKFQIPKMDRKGVTLTELMVTVAILGVMSVLLARLLVGGMHFTRLSQAKGDIERDSRFALDLMVRKLREAQGSTIEIDRFDSSQPNYSWVYFKTIDDEEVKFYQKDRKLHLWTKKSGRIMEKMLAENMRQLIFSYPQSDNDGLVSVSLTFEKKALPAETKALQLAVEKVRIQNGTRSSP